MTVLREEEEFLRLGLQNYVCARAAWMSRFLPLTGTLCHHAVEMFLKARLSQRHTLAELSRHPFGHNLGALWGAFKAEFPAEDLRRFDAMIASLDRFEDHRYPDTLVRRGVPSTGMGVGWSPNPPSATAPPSAASSDYEIVITDVDYFVADILRICSRDPVFLTRSMNEHARATPAHDNPLAAQLIPRP